MAELSPGSNQIHRHLQEDFLCCDSMADPRCVSKVGQTSTSENELSFFAFIMIEICMNKMLKQGEKSYSILLVEVCPGGNQTPAETIKIEAMSIPFYSWYHC